MGFTQQAVPEDIQVRVLESRAVKRGGARSPEVRMEITMHTMTLTGRMPLLMKNINGADPDNPIVKDISRLNALKQKITDEQRAERDFLKWEASLYWDAEDGPILPAANAFRSIQQAAGLTRQGKDVERGLVMHAVHARLDYPGPRNIEGLWGDGKSVHVDRRMAVVNRAPIPTLRPCFPQWAATYEFDLDEDILSLDDFRYFAEKAGRLIKIGDYRRFYGSYTVEIR
jgi:hypothetical protein